MHSFWVAKDSVACSIIPKNGSTSIRNALGTNEVYSNEEVLQFNTRVAFVRDPLDRLHSAYSFFYYLNQSQQNGQPEVQTNSYEEFIDYTFEVNNPHWDLQHSMLSWGNKYLPTHTYKLSQMFDVWGDHYKGLYPWWCNKAYRLECSDYRIDDIKEKYELDYKIWHSL